MKLSDIVHKHLWKIVVLLILAALVAWYVHDHYEDWSREKVVAYGKSLPVVWFLLAFLILPLLGFPISILLVLAGIRFGLGWGMVVAAAGVAVHNVSAYYLIHGWFRHPMRQRLERAGYGIPKIEGNHQIWFTILFAAIHGPPYAVKLYLLALTNVPLKIYFWAGAPVYLFFCLVPVGAGSAVMTFDPTWVYILITAMALLALGGQWLKKKYGGASSGKPTS